MARLDPQVDAYLGGDWHTLDTSTGGTVRQKPPIKIVLGAKDEDTDASPSRCTFTLNDPAGDYDPGNVTGQWYGDLQENTRVRVSVPRLADDFGVDASNSWGTVPGTGETWVNGTSSGGTVAASDWSVSSGSARHSVPAANAYRTSDLPGRLFINSELRYQISLPTSDVTGGAIAVLTKVRTLDDSNHIYVKLVINTNETVQLGIVDKIAGTDRVLLADTTIAGLDAAVHTSLKVAVQAEGQVIRAKVWNGPGVEPLDWQVTCTRATIREGYHGLISVVATGNSNSKPLLFRYVEMSVGIPVFHGEISEFEPGVADESHAAPVVAITASGIGRRVEQGSEPLKSAMFRAWSSNRGWIREGAATSTSSTGSHNTFNFTTLDGADVASAGGYFYLANDANQYKEDQLFTILTKTSGTVTFSPDAMEAIELGDELHSFRLATEDDLPLVYWPMEDERDSTSIASGLVGGAPLEIRGDTPEFAAIDEFKGSAPILKLNDAELYGTVPDYVNTNEAFTIHFLARFPDADEAGTGQAILQFYCTGTAEVWAVQYAAGGSGGDLIVSAWNQAGTQLFSDAWDLDMRGTPRMVTLTVEQTSASTVEYTIASVAFTANGAIVLGGTSPNTDTATSVTTLGKITAFQINPGAGYVETGIGHFAVVPAALDYFNLIDEPNGHFAENLPRRMIRLAYEEDVPLTYCQSPRSSTTLGAQQRDTLLSNLQDAVDVGLGRFYESRGAYSFEYRTRSTLYNQTPVIDLDYGGGSVLDLTPVRDDQGSRNDVSVKRLGGSSARAVKETGPKSVAAIGRYTDAPTINAHTDSQLQGQAEWRLHLGTVAEDRYPTVTVKPKDGVLSLERMLSVGVGDRIRITDAGAIRRYEPIDQLVPGHTLTLHPYVPALAMNCVPASPYTVAVLDDPDARLDSSTTVTTEGLDTTETAISVHSTDNRTPWINSTDHASEFPVDILIGGERMTLTACTSPSGTDLAQTMTVVRSVNGVVKEHDTGAAVTLAVPYYLSF